MNTTEKIEEYYNHLKQGLYSHGCVKIPPHLQDEFKALTDELLKNMREGRHKKKPEGFWDMFADGLYEQESDARARCGIKLNISRDGIDEKKVAEAIERVNAQRDMRESERTPANINHVDLLRNKDGSFKVRLFTAAGLLKVASFRIEADKVQGAPCKCADLEKLREILRPVFKDRRLVRWKKINPQTGYERVIRQLLDPLLDAAKALGIEVNGDE